MKTEKTQFPSNPIIDSDLEDPSPSCNETKTQKFPNPVHVNPFSLEIEKEENPSSNSISDMDVEAPTDSCNKAETRIPSLVQGNPNSRDMEMEETPSSSNSIGNMDAEAGHAAEIVTVRNSSEIPCFLRKVFDAEIENLTGGHNDRLLILAVHAVFLESGFISFDLAKNAAVAQGRLPEQWSGPVFRMRYTLPSLLNSVGNPSVDAIILKFQILGRFVSIYGCSDSKGSDLRHISVDTTEFAPCIDYVYRAYEEDGDLEKTQEKVFFEFWKIVKDGLSTPLLIALCNKMGLPPPSCFMVLPTDLKLLILESIPGVDVARFGCVCSELKYLSSNDELWKKKFQEEFGMGDLEGRVQVGCWKEKFMLHWKRKKMASTSNELPRSLAPFVHMRRGRPQYGAPQGFGMIGGDYDRMIGGDYDRLLIPFGARRVRRIFSPHCNFGYRVMYT